MSAPLRTGLIGAGSWGRVCIRTLQRDSQRFQLKYLVSKNPQASLWALPQTEILSDWRELLEKKDLQALVITTPPDCHTEILRAAMEKRIPTMVEKPLCLKREEAEDLLKLERQTGARVLVDHIHLFSAAYQRLKESLSEIGSIVSIESEGGNAGPIRSSYSALWDYGPHDLSMILDLMGEEPGKVSVRREEVRTDAGVGSNFELEMEFSGGVKTRTRVGNGFPEKRRLLRVKGERGELLYDDLASAKLLLNQETVEISSGTPLERMFQTFYAGEGQLFGLTLSVSVVRVLSRCDHALQ